MREKPVKGMKISEHIYLIGSGCMGLSPEGDCNVYALADGGDIYLVDCGFHEDPGGLLHNMEQDGLECANLRGVLLTHIHPDHAGAVPAFQKMGIPILGCEESAQVLEQGIGAYYRLRERLPPSGFRDYFCNPVRGRVSRVLRPGERIAFGGCTVEMVPTPGHSPDSVCYLMRCGGKTHLFTGDTLFYQGQVSYFTNVLSCTDCYPGTIEALAALRPEGLYPGHLLFSVARGWVSTERAKAYLDAGVLPPIKKYS